MVRAGTGVSADGGARGPRRCRCRRALLPLFMDALPLFMDALPLFMDAPPLLMDGCNTSPRGSLVFAYGCDASHGRPSRPIMASMP
eukprot:992804-Rhodomonas_salina.5